MEYGFEDALPAAKGIHSLFEAFMAVGFTYEEAFELCKAYMTGGIRA